MDLNKRKGLLNRLKNKFRLVILNEDTFEEKISFKLTGLNLFVLLGFSILFLILITFVVIAFTPLREYVPGYSTPGMRRAAIELAIKADSLQQVIHNHEFFFQNIQNIIEGKDPVDIDPYMHNIDSVETEEVTFSKNIEDSLFRLEVEEEQRYNLFTEGVNKSVDFSKIVFFTPIKGVVTSQFDVKIQHYGIDIVAAKNEPVKSVLSGTVVFSAWTSETGHVVSIQHKKGFYSTYKHNSVVLKETGTVVEAGEVIAIIGDSGELTTGPHLHFELWHHGIPVDPENFIVF